MTISIERDVKNQFAKIFKPSDWPIFKGTADYYFESAAKLLKKDIIYGDEELKLLRRNAQKRLYLGIGVELLLKAAFLKNKYCINRVMRGTLNPPSIPFSLQDIDTCNLLDDDTISLSMLIDKLRSVEKGYANYSRVLRGLKIAKVFRNKEGHVALLWHDYEQGNYDDIAYSIIEIYRISFQQILSYKIAMGRGDKAVFHIKSITS